MDMSLFKNFNITERIKAQLRLQAYNLTNTPHFGNPNGDLGGWKLQQCPGANPGCVNVGGGIFKELVANPNAQFGEITGTVPFLYRQVELGLRITF